MPSALHGRRSEETMNKAELEIGMVVIPSPKLCDPSIYKLTRIEDGLSTWTDLVSGVTYRHSNSHENLDWVQRMANKLDLLFYAKYT